MKEAKNTETTDMEQKKIFENIAAYLANEHLIRPDEQIRFLELLRKDDERC